MRRWSVFHRPTVVLEPGLWLTPHHYRDLIDWFRTLGFAVDVPAEHVRGDLDAKALALAKRCRAYKHGGVILLAHSFGAVVAHRAFDLAPEAKELVRGFIALAPVSPNGLERGWAYQLITTHPWEVWDELSNDSFCIPTRQIAQEFFDRDLSGDDWRAFVGEDSHWLAVMLRRSFIRRRELVNGRFRVPKIFIAAAADQFTSGLSLEEWRDFYYMCNPVIMELPGAHCGLLSQKEVFTKLHDWLGKYFTKYLEPAGF